MHPIRKAIAGGSTAPMGYLGRLSGSSNLAAANAGRVALGLQVGDVVVFITNGTLPDPRTDGGSDWTYSGTVPTNSYMGLGVWWKFLDATDLANDWLIDNSAPWSMRFYRGKGATTLTRLSSNAGDAEATGPFTLHTWTPDAKCRGAIFIEVNYNVSVTLNAGWTNRLPSDTTATGTAATEHWYDKLELKPSAGTWSVQLTWGGSGPDHFAWMILEARGP